MESGVSVAPQWLKDSLAITVCHAQSMSQADPLPHNAVGSIWLEYWEI